MRRKQPKKFTVWTRGSSQSFTKWADTAHFLKYLLDNGYEVKGVTKDGNG